MVYNVVILAFLINFCYSTQINTNNENYNIEYNILDNYTINVTIRVADILLSNINKENTNFIRLNTEGAYLSREIGSPELPQFNQLIEIPYESEPRLEIINENRVIYNLDELGNNVKIYPSCQIYSPWNLEIDDYGCLGREVDCLNYVKIKIGKNTTVSKRSFLCTGSRDYKKENKPIVVADIKIGNNCWVAAECFISPGITVEDNSILLARSFLTKDFGPDSLIAGHPAKKIRNLKQENFESYQTINNLQNEENTAKPDITDRASEEIERTIELRTRDRERKLISKIDLALKRIEDGTYGYCEETGDPISIKRLEARPVATLSLESQETHERKEKIKNHN